MNTHPQPSCFLVSNYPSTNSFLERVYQGQPWPQTLHPYLSAEKSFVAVPHNLESISSFSGDITVEGLDGERPLQTGEVVIIVVVLLMWAGE